MKPIVGIVALAAAILASAPASSRAASIEKVREFSEVMGTRKMMADMAPSIVNVMVNALKQNHPNLPPDVFQIVSQVVTETMTPLIPEMQADNEKLYAANFTDEELSAAIGFYRTPAGQSLLRKLPAVTQQSMQGGQAIMAAHLPEMKERLIQELKKRYPDLK